MRRGYLKMYDGIQTQFASMHEMISYIADRFFKDDNSPGRGWTWNQREYFDQYTEVDGWEKVGQGTSRICFKRPNRSWVLKVPRCIRGIYDCRKEAAMFKARHGKLNPLAPSGWQGKLVPCRLVTIQGLSCLIMELVDRSEMKDWDYEDFPQWSMQLKDGRQIGKTKRGEFAVFDYGGEIYDNEWSPKEDKLNLEGLTMLVERVIERDLHG